MFEYLTPFKKIVVTGPPRSGTTIVAHAIEYDIGREYVDESAFRATDYLQWRTLMDKQASFVVQAPGMCRFAHEVGMSPDVAIVLCRRDVEDIVASQERIGWQHEAFELNRYGLTPEDGKRIADVKYDFWDTYQWDVIWNNFEVDYASLAEHPLWVPKEQRTNFDRRQWALTYA
jgi:hypothetical protein